MSRTGSGLACLILAATGIGYLLLALNIPSSNMNADGVGARSYPIVLAVVLISAATLKVILVAREGAGSADRPVREEKSQGVLVLLLPASMVLYFLLLEPLGYLSTTIIMVFAATVSFSSPGKRTGAYLARYGVFAAVLTLTLYAIFDLALGVNLTALPRGW